MSSRPGNNGPLPKVAFLGPKVVSAKVGPPPKGEVVVGFTRMNTHTLQSIEHAQEEAFRTHNERARGTGKAEQHSRVKGQAKGGGAANEGRPEALPSPRAVGGLIPLKGGTTEDFEAPYSVKLQLQIWQDALKEELETYRSVVIASQLLLQRVHEATENQRQPNLLQTAMALTVWTYFLPLLGSYQEVGRGLLDEISHGIFVIPAKSFRLETSAAAYARKTFFDSFFTMVNSYNFHRLRASKFHRMAEHEGRVLDRAVAHWQGSIAARFLSRWRGYAEHAKKLRSKYKKLFQKASADIVVHRVLRLWKRQAHRIMLDHLAHQNSKSNEQLKAAHLLDRQTKDRLKLAQEECNRKERHLTEATLAREKVLELHRQLTSDVAAARIRYLTIRALWAMATMELFDDIHRVPSGVDYAAWVDAIVLSGGVGVDWRESSNGAGESTTSKTLKITPTAVRKVMEWLVGTGTGTNMASSPLLGGSPKRTAVPLTSVGNSSAELTDRAQLAAGNSKMLDAEISTNLFTQLTKVSPPPLQVQDILRGDPLKIKYFFLLLMELHSGGQCSVFFPNHSPLSIGTPAGARYPGLAAAEVESRRALPTAPFRRYSTASGESTDDDDGAKERDKELLSSIAQNPASLLSGRNAVKGDTSVLYMPRFLQEIVTPSLLEQQLLNAGMGARRRSVLTEISSVGKSMAAGVGSKTMGDAAQMTYDWNDGLQQLKIHNCNAQRHLETLSVLSQFGEVMQTEREAQRLFDFLVSLTSSGEVSRPLVESATSRFIPEEDLEIAGFAFPSTGISNISEFVQYASDLGALIGRPVGEVLQLLDSNLEVSPAMIFLLSCRENDVQLITTSFSHEISRAFKKFAVREEKSEATALKAKRGSFLLKGQTTSPASPSSGQQKTDPRQQHPSAKSTTPPPHTATMLVISDTGIQQFVESYNVPLEIPLAMQITHSLRELVPILEEEGFAALLCSFAAAIDPAPFASLSLKVKLFLTRTFA